MLLFVSCYDDKGNYDYEDINTVAVELDELYSVRLDKDTTLTIVPRLSQLDRKSTRLNSSHPTLSRMPSSA